MTVGDKYMLFLRKCVRREYVFPAAKLDKRIE